jgi:heme o synthase
MFTAALIAGSILPWLLNMSGWLYGAGALALGLWFLRRTDLLAVDRTRVRARSVLLASVAYLPLLYGLMVLDNIH